MSSGQIMLMLNGHAIMTISNSLQISILQPSWEGMSWNHCLHVLACGRSTVPGPRRLQETATLGSYVSAVVDPRPRVLTPRPPPLCPRYQNRRTSMTEAASQDGHRLSLR